SSATRTNGVTSIGLAVFKTQEANTLAVVNAVKAKLDGLQADTGAAVRVLSDQGEPIAEGVSGLVREGALGGVFAVLVVLLFLGNLRTTLVTALSIPLSILVALLLLQWQGLSLNVLTLGGLSIAIGRVIDDAIVVIENVYRRLGAGDPPVQAALNGAREVSAPVTASTITTVGVFLPLAFVPGIAGEFFRPLALAVTWAILASLLVAFTVIPLLSSLFVTRAPREASGPNFLERVYRPTIVWVTGHKALTVLGSVVLLAASGFLASRLPTNFVTGGTPTAVNGTLKLPDGTRLAVADAESRKVEAKLAALKAEGVIDTYQAVVGGADSPFALAFGAGSGAAASFTVLPAKGVTVEALQARLERDLNGVASGPLTWQLGSGGGGFSNSVDIQVQANDPAALSRASAAILAAVQGVPEVRNARSSLAAVKQEFAVKVDQEKAYRAGVVPATVAGRVREALQGTTAATLTIAQQPVDVQLTFPAGAYGTLDRLKALPVKATLGGPAVRLDAIASITAVPGPTSITRLNGNRTVTVSADPRGQDVGAASRAVQSAVK
ncbi:MAG TPA: efflux RND transporter permease subunit, partial [Deinococcales bacterium]|nr:efflux RND transporter permease subunit [Deinococcales bacterium]